MILLSQLQSDPIAYCALAGTDRLERQRDRDPAVPAGCDSEVEGRADPLPPFRLDEISDEGAARGAQQTIREPTTVGAGVGRTSPTVVADLPLWYRRDGGPHHDPHQAARKGAQTGAAFPPSADLDGPDISQGDLQGFSH